LAYIGLKPKSSHIIKYSQPFELVLFHIIAFRIKCLKGSYYSHLLNNYLINYLFFSGLTNTIVPPIPIITGPPPTNVTNTPDTSSTTLFLNLAFAPAHRDTTSAPSRRSTRLKKAHFYLKNFRTNVVVCYLFINYITYN